jgi:hypothetical protein
MALQNLLAVDPSWQLAASVAGATCQAAVLYIYIYWYTKALPGCRHKNQKKCFVYSAVHVCLHVVADNVMCAFETGGCAHFPVGAVGLRGTGPDSTPKKCEPRQLMGRQRLYALSTLLVALLLCMQGSQRAHAHAAGARCVLSLCARMTRERCQPTGQVCDCVCVLLCWQESALLS